VEHLAALGHRDVAFISGPKRLHSAQSRLVAFTRSIEECALELDPAWIVEGDHTMEGGMAAMEQLLKSKQVPTAVMCSNDMTAIGVLHKLYRAGLKVPDDLSVIGFDDIHMAQFTVPPLTSVRMAGSDLATAACNALPLSPGLNGHAISKDRLLVPTQLTVRQTSGYVRKGNGRSVAGKMKVKPSGRAGKNME